MSPCTWPQAESSVLKKASFSMDLLLHAETLEYLCSFQGGMEDPRVANQQMLQKVLAIKEQHFGKHQAASGVHFEQLGKRTHEARRFQDGQRAPRPRSED